MPFQICVDDGYSLHIDHIRSCCAESGKFLDSIVIEYLDVENEKIIHWRLFHLRRMKFYKFIDRVYRIQELQICFRLNYHPKCVFN